MTTIARYTITRGGLSLFLSWAPTSR